jgi:hypothetical protein
MSNTAMTTPTPLSKTSYRSLGTNTTQTAAAMPRPNQQRLNPTPLMPITPMNLFAPQMPSSVMPPAMMPDFVNQITAQPQQMRINPVTGEEITEEEYQRMFGQMTPPGMPSNQLAPQSQASVQAIATQPRIF